MACRDTGAYVDMLAVAVSLAVGSDGCIGIVIVVAENETFSYRS